MAGVVLGSEVVTAMELEIVVEMEMEMLIVGGWR